MAINKSQVTAIILAGGKGQRMGGKDKGLVSYQGKPLIKHVFEKISSQIEDIKIIANRNLSEYSQFADDILSDELSNFQGPLAGMAIAMKKNKTDYILTLPCDAPLLPDDYVTRMTAIMPSNSKRNTIVVAHDGKRLQSVHALIPVSMISNLNLYLKNGNRRIDLWYKQHNMVVADFSDSPEAFLNINTKEQLNNS